MRTFLLTANFFLREAAWWGTTRRAKKVTGAARDLVKTRVNNRKVTLHLVSVDARKSRRPGMRVNYTWRGSDRCGVQRAIFFKFIKVWPTIGETSLQGFRKCSP